MKQIQEISHFESNLLSNGRPQEHAYQNLGLCEPNRRKLGNGRPWLPGLPGVDVGAEGDETPHTSFMHAVIPQASVQRRQSALRPVSRAWETLQYTGGLRASPEGGATT